MPTLICNADRTICRDASSSESIIAGLFGKVIRAGSTRARGDAAGGGVAGDVIVDDEVTTAFEIPDPIAFDMPAPMVVTVVAGGE